MDAAETHQTTSKDTVSTATNVLNRPSGFGQGAVEQAVKAERERIARLLHDDVLQSFATCLLKAQLCERLAEMGRYDQVKSELPALEKALSDTIDRVRAIAVMLKEPENKPNSL